MLIETVVMPAPSQNIYPLLLTSPSLPYEVCVGKIFKPDSKFTTEVFKFTTDVFDHEVTTSPLFTHFTPRTKINVASNQKGVDVCGVRHW